MGVPVIVPKRSGVLAALACSPGLRRARSAPWQEEIREFQQRNWAEMKAAAERNKRQLMAKVMEEDGGDGGAPAEQEEVTVDDDDVADQAAMYEDMARIYRRCAIASPSAHLDSRSTLSRSPSSAAGHLRLMLRRCGRRKLETIASK